MQNKIIISLLKNFLVYALILLVVGGLGSWFLFQKVKIEEANLEKAKIDYNTTLSQINSFSTIKGDFESSKNLKDQVENMVIQSEGALDLIKELEQAAQLTGVSLKTEIGERPGARKNIAAISKAKSTENANQETWLLLQVEGPFENTLRFIKYLENAKKMISVSTLSIKQAQSINSGDLQENQSLILGNLKTEILITNAF